MIFHDGDQITRRCAFTLYIGTSVSPTFHHVVSSLFRHPRVTFQRIRSPHDPRRDRAKVSERYFEMGEKSPAHGNVPSDVPSVDEKLDKIQRHARWNVPSRVHSVIPPKVKQ